MARTSPVSGASSMRQPSSASSVSAAAGADRRGRLGLGQGRRRAFPVGGRQLGDGGVEVGALLGPGRLGVGEAGVRGARRREGGAVPGRLVAQVALDVDAPGVLGDQGEAAAEGAARGVEPLGGEGVVEPLQRPEAGELDGVAGGPVDPAVAELDLHHRQLGAARPDDGGVVLERPRADARRRDARGRCRGAPRPPAARSGGRGCRRCARSRGRRRSRRGKCVSP